MRRVTENDLGLEVVSAERPAAVEVKPPQVPGAVGAVVEIVRGTRSEKYNVTRSN